jgi:peptide deformylase
VQIPVTRNASIEISAFDVNGKEFKKSLNGLAARCFQHEQDHLDGITLWHHATEKSKKRISELAAVGGDEEWQRSRNQDS